MKKENNAYVKKLDKIFARSKKVDINNNSKIVIMSDCHRGFGNIEDNFKKNKDIYNSALQYYFDNGYTYIELGDGDEMWEVKNYQKIIDEHIESFRKIKKFYDDKRFLMIYGNHDIVKKKISILKKYFYVYEDKTTKKREDLFFNLKVYESLVLQYMKYDIFLIHGHQVSFLNSTLWPIARFLVRHLWGKLEQMGFSDPTSAAKNYTAKNRVEKILQKWSEENNKILIAGHTHRPIFPAPSRGLYFNDGSCVHPNGITCIEIERGNISLVKWEANTNGNLTSTSKKSILAGPVPIEEFFKLVSLNKD